MVGASMIVGTFLFRHALARDIGQMRTKNLRLKRLGARSVKASSMSKVWTGSMIYPNDHNTLETPEQVAELLAALQSELEQEYKEPAPVLFEMPVAPRIYLSNV